ncbi:MAG TPA: ribonuclease HI family protein, partial [Anaerolineae bacterium]|nr:ribonuclease HI family protein [Anaerolineae bacterium]
AEMKASAQWRVFPMTLYSPLDGPEPPVTYETLPDGWQQYVVNNPAELRLVTAAIKRYHNPIDDQPVTLNFDGACENGQAAWGYVISKDGNILDQSSGLAKDSTSNVAEYAGLIAGLKAVIKLGAKGQVTVRGDSQLVIYQMMGRYQVRANHLKPLYFKAKELASQLGSVSFEWVPREENQKADELSKRSAQREEVKTGQLVTQIELAIP